MFSGLVALNQAMPAIELMTRKNVNSTIENGLRMRINSPIPAML